MTTEKSFQGAEEQRITILLMCVCNAMQTLHAFKNNQTGDRENTPFKIFSQQRMWKEKDEDMTN